MLGGAVDPCCTGCRTPLSIDEFDPIRKELRCTGCGVIAVVVRGNAPLGSVPLPRGLRIQTGATLVLTWARPLAWAAIAGGVALLALALVVEPGALFGLAGLMFTGGGGFDLWRQPVLRAGPDAVAARRGAFIPLADLDQLYVRRGLAGFEVRATDRQGGDWPLLEVPTLWDALAVEHLVEGHLGITDAPVPR